MKDYRRLEIWRRSPSITLAIYTQTKSFPKEELFGLTSQLRRSCSSVPANIAGGCGRESDAELKRFLDIAHGSASEASYFLLLASELSCLKPLEYEHLASEPDQVKKMLGAFSRRLKAERR